MKYCVIMVFVTGTVKDKIFVSSENEVRGYTKKGKLFLGFDTNLTEHIKSMWVKLTILFVTFIDYLFISAWSTMDFY